MNADTNTQLDSVLFRYKRLLTSDFRSSTRGERHNSYYADCTIWPHKRAVHPVVFKISSGRNLHISMVRLQLLNTIVFTQLQLSTWPKSTFQLDWSPFDNQLDRSPVNYQLDWPTVEYQLVSFKIPKFSAYHFWA